MPRRVLRQVARVAAWVLPSSSAVLGSLALVYRWLGDRASVDDVTQMIAPTAIAAKEAQALGHHCSSIGKEHEQQLEAAWAEIVALHAELEVYRRYPNKDAHTRGDLIYDAVRFFRLEFDQQLEHTHDPAESARRALLARWRP